MSSSPILIYIFSIYSIGFLVKTKTRNEFLLILLLFLTLLQMGPFPNRIEAFITSPINVRPLDIALILFSFLSLQNKMSKPSHVPIAFRDPLIGLFFIIVLLYTLVGVLKHGYAGIAEFRSVFFYVVILLFIATNIKNNEFIPLIRKISIYLIPLILLVPVNLILTGNYMISIGNRQLNAITYETITVAFLSGYIYNQYYDRTFNLPIYLLPVFIIAFPYCNHRTVWAIIFATFPIILFWTRKGRLSIYTLIMGVTIAIYLQLDSSFLLKRMVVFENIEMDTTGRWRMYIWQAVLSQATLLGNGLGERWHVVADVIGKQAMKGAHNGYIQILYYLGYLGFVLIIVLCGYLLLHFYKRTNMENTQGQVIYRLGLLSTIALCLYMFGYGPDILSWIFIGFGLKLTCYKKKKGFFVEPNLP